ncbi:MAG: DUF455 family protein [Planctomycetota bacterium]|nr:MAG: DUF455 family protein [Planctomycetota bacterium]
MELRNFAERVLFGDTLEDKLWEPETLTDERPGNARTPPEAPGRPRELLFARAGSDAPPTLPPAGPLQDPRARGFLLHRFANHELLALELMALVLLRFPDAPTAFRRGLARTLREEQAHLRLYLERMGELGVSFGELPLSAFFWRSLSRVEDPLRFVVAMSLTFEQANLDHAAATARRFEKLGDERTARLLWRIHDDEVGHVRAGQRWFERWRPGRQSAWTEFRSLLPRPLTPARAKGPRPSLSARLRAGLGGEFVRELLLHGGSKGRPPDVLAFVSSFESDLARGRTAMPDSRSIAALEEDLAPLLAWCARPGDVVLVPRLPGLEHRERFDALGAPRVDLRSFDADGLAALAAERLGRVFPWGWGPGSRHRLAPLLSSAGEWARRPLADQRWAASKQTAATLLRAALAARPGAEGLCPPSVVGRTCRNLAEVEAHARALWDAGYPAAAVKAPFGTCGRGILRLRPGDPTPSQRGWLRRVLSRQEQVLVEPWLPRVADLSVCFDVGPGGAEGRPRIARSLTDARGQYLGHVLSPSGKLLGLPPDALRALHRNELLDLLRAVVEEVAAALAARGYRGPAGVDALLYRDLAGAVRLQPLLEVNPRTTMGRLAEGLCRCLAPGRVGLWLHIGRRAWERTGCARASELAAALPNPETRGTPPRLAGGAVCTNDPDQATARLTVLAAGASLEACAEVLGAVGLGLPPGLLPGGAPQERGARGP